MKEKYIFNDLEVLEFSEKEESEDSPLLLKAYARIAALTDGGCGSDGGGDGGPPYC
jgi:hypothetical protein